MIVSKRIEMGIIVLVFAVLACQFLPSTPEPPDDTAIETLTAATLNAQATLLPSETPAPSETPTRDDRFPIVTLTVPLPPQPSPTVDTFFRDDFTGALSDGWTWIREDPQRWSLSEKPGVLRIILDPTKCRGVPGNLPLVSPPKGDYQMDTLVEFSPINNFQLAGLIVYQDDDNYLKFGKAFCNLEGNCLGNGIYFDDMVAGNFGDQNFATAVENQTNVYLRLQHQKGVYTGYYSADGENWTMIGEHTSAIYSSGIGLFAGQSCSGSIPADFDYFSVSQLP